ncbi:hypothetical protein B0H13DRAFT_1130798 [Mycena leptocephala]|nr:hypothetical protein B0H13DRAFT_1130798 [Mycena leptocephala]
MHQKFRGLGTTRVGARARDMVRSRCILFDPSHRLQLNHTCTSYLGCERDQRQPSCPICTIRLRLQRNESGGYRCIVSSLRRRCLCWWSGGVGIPSNTAPHTNAARLRLPSSPSSPTPAAFSSTTTPRTTSLAATRVPRCTRPHPAEYYPHPHTQPTTRTAATTTHAQYAPQPFFIAHSGSCSVRRRCFNCCIRDPNDYMKEE